jgi:hypothetical protein
MKQKLGLIQKLQLPALAGLVLLGLAFRGLSERKSRVKIRNTDIRAAIAAVALAMAGWLLPVPGQAAGPLDHWHWRAPSPQGNSLYGVAFGANRFVAVGASGVMVTSADGANWTVANSGTVQQLHAITYGGGRFVAVGTSGTILSSTDGINWTPGVAANAHGLNAVAYGNGMFVAVGESGVIQTSSDGLMWHSVNSTIIYDMNGVAYGNGLFVATVSNGQVLTSSGGTVWARGSSGTSALLYNVAWGAGRFVAAASSGIILNSAEGQTGALAGQESPPLSTGPLTARANTLSWAGAVPSSVPPMV